jgi:23S rRNA (guanine745-N1)-methyltransferase
MVTMLCPVRDCRESLARDDQRLACSRGHSFDVARRGYVNLLQPQDRRSPHPGDSPAAVTARARLREQGTEREFVERIAALVPAAGRDAVLDVGCGDGAHVAAVAARSGCEGHGLDISVAAIEAAARRHPALHWVVGNADRFIPYADRSFATVLSITARLNAAEFRRVLRDGGTLVVVVPAPDDLIELRAAVLAEGVVRPRTARVIEACTPLFTVTREEQLRGRAVLDADAVADVLASTYRAFRWSERARAETVGPLDVTLARDVLVFRPR